MLCAFRYAFYRIRTGSKRKRPEKFFHFCPNRTADRASYRRGGCRRSFGSGFFRGSNSIDLRGRPCQSLNIRSDRQIRCSTDGPFAARVLVRSFYRLCSLFRFSLLRRFGVGEHVMRNVINVTKSIDLVRGINRVCVIVKRNVATLCAGMRSLRHLQLRHLFTQAGYSSSYYGRLQPAAATTSRATVVEPCRCDRWGYPTSRPSARQG